MIVNVAEWTSDWYDTAHKYRFVRGGSWLDVPWFVRVSYRLRVGPGYRRGGLGCRCAQ